jgi:hypothetical protein
VAVATRTYAPPTGTGHIHVDDGRARIVIVTRYCKGKSIVNVYDSRVFIFGLGDGQCAALSSRRSSAYMRDLLAMCIPTEKTASTACISPNHVQLLATSHTRNFIQLDTAAAILIEL